MTKKDIFSDLDKRYKRLFRYNKKKKQYINKITGKPIKKETARRYQTRYINLRKKGLRPSQITMDMLYGNKYTYKSEKTKALKKRKLQVRRTKTATGKTIYKDIKGKKVKKSTYKKAKKTPIRTKWGMATLYPYRLSTRTRQVHHILYIPIDKRFYSPHRFTMWRIQMQPKLNKFIESLPKIVKKYPLTGMPMHYGRIEKRAVHSASRMSRDHSESFGQTRLSNTKAIKYSLDEVLDHAYEFLLVNNYSSVEIKELSFNIYDDLIGAEERLGYTQLRRKVQGFRKRR